MLRYPQAIDAYKQAVVIDIKNELANFRLGELYLRMGNRELAEQKYRFLRFLKSGYADELLRDINKK
jgi:tetratricopeptide (TPR) repeat protein